MASFACPSNFKKCLKFGFYVVTDFMYILECTIYLFPLRSKVLNSRMTIISLLETEYSEESRLTSYGHKYAIQSLEIMHNNLVI